MEKTHFTNSEIMEKFNRSLSYLFEKDKFLLENSAHERSVAHKLAEYLQVEFPDRNVDCEYNLHGKITKLLDGINECSIERTTDRIFPDIIIHIRDSDDWNTLVIEIKTGNGSRDCDLIKLEKLTDKNINYGYQIGLFIKFNQLEEPEIIKFTRH